MADKPATVVLDDEGKALALEAEKAKLRQSIAEAAKASGSAAWSGLTASVTGAPTGSTTAGEAAGAFAPWLASRSLGDAAAYVATQAGTELPDEACVLVAPVSALRDERWAAEHVLRVLARASTRLEVVTSQLQDSVPDVPDADEYARAERADDEDHHDDDDDEGGNGGRRRSAGELDEAVRMAIVADVDPATKAAGDEKDTEKEEPAPAGEPKPSTSAGAGALTAALSLLELTRTDYTLDAVPVTITHNRLATLVAGHLRSQGKDTHVVELDGLSAPDGPVMARLTALEERRDAAQQALTALVGRAAPLEAVLAGWQSEVIRLQALWTLLLASEKDEVAARAEAVHTHLQAATRSQDRCALALAGPHAVLAAARQLLADVDAEVRRVCDSSEGQPSLLQRALARDRLRTAHGEGGQGAVTHVLAVSADGAWADRVTRRAVLGESGRVTFLGSVSTSWVLVEAGSGAVLSAGGSDNATRMQHDLGSGKTSSGPVDPSAAVDLGPERGEEAWKSVRYLVLGLAAFLAAAAALAAVTGALDVLRAVGAVT